MKKVAICDDDGQLAHQLENIICKICDRESIGVMGNYQMWKKTWRKEKFHFLEYTNPIW